MKKLIMLPGPTNVPEPVMRAMLEPMMNHRGPSFTKLWKSITERGQRVFQTSGDIIALTTSGTGGVEASVTNLIRKGDKVIVTIFGEFGTRLSEEIEDMGAHVVEVTAPFGDAPTISAVQEAFEQNSQVKALYVVANETSTGVGIGWLKQAGELCSKYGAFFIADAVSNLGGDGIPVDAYNIDICVTASQKCIAAPPGLSILSISKRAKQYMVENPPPLQYLNLPRYFKYAEKGETPFTPALPLYSALDCAFGLMLEEGMEKRVQRHKICADSFYAAFKAMGLEAFAKDASRSNTVIALKYPQGLNDKQFRAAVEENYGVVLAGGFGEFNRKLFRVGSMGEVNKYHVHATVSAVANTMRQMGMHIDADAAMSAANSVLKSLS